MGVDEYSFKAFSQHAFYREVNRWLVEHARLERGWTVVDVACGSGAVTELIVEQIRGARSAVVIGLDVSTQALRDAQEKLAGARGAAVEFVQAQAEEMSRAVRRAADAVIFCNGIHYIRDKHRLLAEVYRTLRPGGVFAFNSAFFQGAHPPETQRFYRRWMMKAMRTLRDEHGLKPAREKVEARRPLEPAEYRSMLEGQGFRITTEQVVTVPVSEQGWLDLSRFSDFVGGALPGIPITTASEILCRALRDTFHELRLFATPRNWLCVIAARLER